jgi:hypothetical protein
MSGVARQGKQRVKSFGLILMAGAMAGIAIPHQKIQPVFNIPLVECPHSFTPFLDSAVVPGQLTLSGRITNVPEFHDCQKFIVTQGQGFSYLPVFAIFGAWDLGTRWNNVMIHSVSYRGDVRFTVPLTKMSGDSATVASLSTVTLPAPSVTARAESSFAIPAPSPGGRGWAFVEILSEGSYPALGIGPGFNCAYIFLTVGGLQARMVHFAGLHEPDCRPPVDPDSLPGTDLQVQWVNQPMHQSAADYPSAARWDWDSEHRIQYFGVKCGSGWCEVGPKGFVASPLPAFPSMADGAASYWHRVRHIKGWFDQQRLAPALIANPPGPEAGWGEVFADPLLVKYKVVDFSRSWRLVARARLDSSLTGYEEKWNLGPTDYRNKENRLYFCHASWSVCYLIARGFSDLARGYDSSNTKAPDCGAEANYPDVVAADRETWWVGIVSTTGKVRFGCVIRRDHAADYAEYGLSPNGTVRWRWYNQDETIWASCDAGCCQVQKPRT